MRERTHIKRLVLIVAAAGALGLGAAVAFGAAGAGKTTNRATTAATVTVKVWLCHHTRSWKHPYRLIHVAADASAAHQGHGDLQAGTANACPSAQRAGGRNDGENGSAHGNSAVAKAKHVKKPAAAADDDDKDEKTPTAGKP